VFFVGSAVWGRGLQQCGARTVWPCVPHHWSRSSSPCASRGSRSSTSSSSSTAGSWRRTQPRHSGRRFHGVSLELGFVRSGSATAMHVSRGVRGRRAGRGRGTAGGRVGVPVAQRSCSPPGALSGGGIELAPLESFDPPLRCFYRACEVGLVLF
jgi:hypothetical protein